MEIFSNIYTIMVATAIILLTMLLRFVFRLIRLGQILKGSTPYVEPDLQNRFSKTKIPKDIDYIVIGSGTSGLSCASVLSKLGKKVLVLEQHDRIGGCFHTFEEQGFEFDSGFHYVGNVKPFRYIISMLGSKVVEWNVFKHFDTIQYGEERIEFIAPLKTFYENLVSKFPESKDAINKYKAYGKQSQALQQGIVASCILPRIIGKVLHAYLSRRYSHLYKKSTQEIFDTIGISKNQKLALILAGESGDLGTNLNQLDFSMHISLLIHYQVKGSMYPKKGTKDIIQSISSTIIQKGGSLLTKAYVDKINVEGKKVTGVTLRGGVEIKAKNVISTMGIPNTLKSLPENCNSGIPSNFEYDTAFNCYSLFLGVNTKGLERPPTYNLWYLPKNEGAITYNDIDADNDKYQDQKHRPLFVSFPTAKTQADTDKQAICVISQARWKWVEDYRVNEVRRQEEYEAHKKKIQGEMVDQFKKLFPLYKDSIEYQNLGTPLTFETYYNRKTPYGLQLTVEKLYDPSIYFKTTTNVKGLHLSGQDLCFPGFIGSLMMGILTAVRATGYV